MCACVWAYNMHIYIYMRLYVFVYEYIQTFTYADLCMLSNTHANMHNVPGLQTHKDTQPA
jgi:hypothetical protein